MKLVKSLLLGSAAGLCAVAGAQAADLPVRRAAPVEYVRVCTAYGAGFFYIPGTDTCIRVGGRARFEYQYTSTGVGMTPNNVGTIGSLVNGDLSGFRSLGRLNLDSRTQTAYGTLRAFVRFDILTASGGYLTSGTAQRFATAFPALGQDTFGRLQTGVNIDKAFVQFAGITAGKANSFFDFYAHDLEFITATSGSDVSSTTLLAYTFTFGQGFSATISAEDPIQRRQPIFPTANLSGATLSSSTGANFTTVLGSFVSIVPGPGFSPIAGGNVAFVDVVQRERLPDFVGVLRYDAPWGAAQVSGAVHELFVGKYAGGYAAAAPNAAGGFTTGAAVAPFALRQPQAEYGFAVQGGLKINLPQLAAGDVLWLQAAYSDGALSYTGIPLRISGSENTTNTLGRFSLSSVDGFIGANGQIKTTEAFSVSAAFLHYFTPEVRGALFGSYSEVAFGSGARNQLSPVNFNNGAVNQAFNSLLKDYNVFTVGGNLIWSPVRDLDIGVEAVYQRVELQRGRTLDGNIGSLGAAVAGVPTGRLVREDDVFMTRMRIQRDF